MTTGSLVFVHDACLGPWTWTEHFVPFFESLGWRCLAPDLHDAWPHGRGGDPTHVPEGGLRRPAAQARAALFHAGTADHDVSRFARAVRDESFAAWLDTGRVRLDPGAPPHAGHCIMLEAGWLTAARHIQRWLTPEPR
jgi:hypothetical protein